MIFIALLGAVVLCAATAALFALICRSERRVLFAAGVEALCVAWLLFVVGYEYLALLTAVISIFVILVGYIYIVAEADAEKVELRWYFSTVPALVLVAALSCFIGAGIYHTVTTSVLEGKKAYALGELFVHDNRLSLYVMALALLVVVVGGASVSRKEKS